MGVQRILINIYCYSKTSSAQTLSVYDALYKNLNGLRLWNDNLDPKGYVYESKRPDTGYNKEIRAWYSLGEFIINTATS